MTNTIGRVDFKASLDGRGVENDAKRVGREMGKSSAAGYDETWQTGFKDSLTKAGKLAYEEWKKNGSESGRIYSTAMTDRINKVLKEANKNFEALRLDAGFLDEWNKNFDDASLAAGELQKQILLLSDAGETNASALAAARRQVDEWAQSQRDAAIESNKAAESMERESEFFATMTENTRQHNQARANLLNFIRQNNAALEEGNDVWVESNTLLDVATRRLTAHGDAASDASFKWSDLSHNTRQWTLIIGAVLAGMQEIAVLGSAAGAGLVALGGAATAGIAGVGGIAAVFVTLNKELDELPAHLRPVAEEFKDFTSVFGELREAVANGAFPQMGGVFDGLGASLRALAPALTTLGVSVGDVFSDLEENTRNGTDAFNEIRQAIRLAGPNFESLAASSGTFGEALVRSMNRAQPLVADLLGYVDRLANQFDEFSRSDGFTEWIERSQATWESFGGLLDAIGRGLNDLVTPESAARTQGFLDNLTDFVPHLTSFLDVLGRLDVFGIIAEGLVAFGEALSPLAGPAAELATALNVLIVDVLQTFAPVLQDIATVIAPVVSGLAGLVSALPDAGASQGLLILTGAIVAFKAAANISGTLTAMAGLQTTLGGMGAVGATAARGVGLAATALKGLSIGSAVIVGAGLLAKGLSDLAGAGAKAAPSVERIAEAMQSGNLEFAFSNASTSADSFAESLNLIAGNDLKANMERFGETIGAAFGITGVVTEARDSMASLDEALAQMVGSGQAEQAAALFNDMALQANAQGVEFNALMELFPAYDSAVLTTAQATDAARVAMEGVSGAILGAGDAALTTTAEIDELAGKIVDFQTDAYGARDAARDYQSAIDDLTQSIADNGTSLDITTEQGRANEQAIDDLAAATLNNSAETLKNTDNQALAREEMQKGRDQLIKMLEQFGITGKAAEDYADELGLIPSDVISDVALRGVQAAEAALANLVRQRTAQVTVNFQRGADSVSTGVERPGYAAGGMLYGPRDITAGEAGTEAIVPMNRPLSQVDPSVRWLSAIAQGLAPVPMAAGGMVGGGTSVTFAEGSVVAYQQTDAGATANEFVRQIFERLNG